MDTYVALLQNYQTRDKILRTVCYGSAFASGAFRGKMAKDLGMIAQKISACRTVNRLFDDVPMWTITKTLGATEGDLVSRGLTALANIAIQLYFPIEKIAWASDNEILDLQSAPWWTAGVGCWAVFILLNILRSLRQLSLAAHRIRKVLKERKLSSPEKGGEKDLELRQKIADFRDSQRVEYLMLIKNFADFVMCVNWLPLGMLWSGKLSPARNAFFGTISSVVGLYVSISQHQKKLKKT